MSWDITTPKELAVTASLNQLRAYWCLRTTQYRAGRAVQETLAEIGEALRRDDGRPLLQKARVSEGLRWLTARGWAVYDQAEQGYRCTEPTGYDQLLDTFDPRRRYDAETGRRLLQAAPQGSREVLRNPKRSVTDFETTPYNTIKKKRRTVTDSETDEERRAALLGELAGLGVYVDLAVRLTGEHELDWIARCARAVAALKARGAVPHAGALTVKLIRGEEELEPLEQLPRRAKHMPAPASREASPMEWDEAEEERLREQLGHRSMQYLEKYLTNARGTP